MRKEPHNQLATRLFGVLDILFLNFATGFTQSEIREKTGLDASTVHRYVNTLIEVGYAEEIQGTKRYRPSHRLAQRAVQVMHSLEMQEQDARSSLNRITRSL
jgi:DNA-binding IclR family transcriptional regulator